MPWPKKRDIQKVSKPFKMCLMFKTMFLIPILTLHFTLGFYLVRAADVTKYVA